MFAHPSGLKSLTLFVRVASVLTPKTNKLDSGCYPFEVGVMSSISIQKETAVKDYKGNCRCCDDQNTCPVYQFVYGNKSRALVL